MNNLVALKAKDKDVDQKKKLNDLHTTNTTATSKLLSLFPQTYEIIPLNGATHELFLNVYQRVAVFHSC